MEKHFCDRCGKEIKDLHVVSITTRDDAIIDRRKYTYTGVEERISVELCDDCINDLNLKMLYENKSERRAPKEDVKEQFFSALKELTEKLVEENVNER